MKALSIPKGRETGVSLPFRCFLSSQRIGATKTFAIIGEKTSFHYTSSISTTKAFAVMGEKPSFLYRS